MPLCGESISRSVIIGWTAFEAPQTLEMTMIYETDVGAGGADNDSPLTRVRPQQQNALCVWLKPVALEDRRARDAEVGSPKVLCS